LLDQSFPKRVYVVALDDLLLALLDLLHHLHRIYYLLDSVDAMSVIERNWEMRVRRRQTWKSVIMWNERQESIEVQRYRIQTWASIPIDVNESGGGRSTPDKLPSWRRSISDRNSSLASLLFTSPNTLSQITKSRSSD
jgi:hypothetical protein